MDAQPQKSEGQPPSASAHTSPALLNPLIRTRRRWRWLIIGVLLVSIVLSGILLGPMRNGLFGAVAQSFGGQVYLDDVAMSAQGEGWAVGAYLFNAGGLRESIWHDDHNRWREIPAPASTKRDWLRGVAGLPSGDAWAVGNNGAILYEHNGAWSSVTSPTTDDLQSVAMRSATEGWAIGGHVPQIIATAPGSVLARFAYTPSQPFSLLDTTTCDILHYIGGSWKRVACPVKSPLNGVTVLPNGDAWGVGDGGVILHEHDNTWTAVASPTYATLNAVAMVSPTDGWAVGFLPSDHGGSILLHDEAGHWIEQNPNTSTDLDGIVMNSSTQGWIVGDSGTILDYSEGGWNSYPTTKASATADVLFGVTTIPGGGSVAVGVRGNTGLVLKEHGGVWTTDATP